MIARDLVGVLQILESISKPSLMERITKNKTHAGDLVGCKEKLEHGFMKFMVGSIDLQDLSSCKICSSFARYTAPLLHDFKCITIITPSSVKEM
jgi:hypothetical protein